MTVPQGRDAVHALGWFIETGYMERYLQEFAAHIANSRQSPRFIDLPRGTCIDVSKLVGWQRLPDKLYVFLQGHEGLVFEGDDADVAVSLLSSIGGAE